MRKEGIVLWHITDTPLLGREIVVLSTVVERLAVKQNVASIWLYRPGDRL